MSSGAIWNCMEQTSLAGAVAPLPLRPQPTENNSKMETFYSVDVL